MVVNFFKAYTESKVNEIQQSNQQLIDLKLYNKQILNKQAAEFTECSEYENLLLDAVDACRKGVMKRQQEDPDYRTQQLKSMGVSGQMLMDAVCLNKETLVLLFQQLFD